MVIIKKDKIEKAISKLAMEFRLLTVFHGLLDHVQEGGKNIHVHELGPVRHYRAGLYTLEHALKVGIVHRGGRILLCDAGALRIAGVRLHGQSHLQREATERWKPRHRKFPGPQFVQLLQCFFFFF